MLELEQGSFVLCVVYKKDSMRNGVGGYVLDVSFVILWIQLMLFMVY
jgi:hypothetical protein